MSHPLATNTGFRPQDLSRRDFQVTTATVIDKHAQAIQSTREFMADLSVRLDQLEARLVALEAKA